MKYRKIDPATGDMQFGHGSADFHIDVPEAVAQAVVTRLRLWTGDWFLDLEAGTDWLGQVLGTGTRFSADVELRGRIGGTTGLTGLTAFSSRRNGDARTLSVQATIDTAYGVQTLAARIVRAPLVPWGQAMTTLQGQDGDTLFGPDAEPLVGPNDPNLLIYI